MTKARRVVIAGSDLFFATRIRTAARAAGAEVIETPVGELAQAMARERPDLVIVDLHASGDPIAAAGALARDPATAGIRIVGYYSHVEDALRRQAIEAGIEAMPRSAFTAKLAELLGA